MTWCSKIVVAAFAALVASAIQPVLAGDAPTGPKPETTPELLAEGEAVYFRRCSFCHFRKFLEAAHKTPIDSIFPTPDPCPFR